MRTLTNIGATYDAIAGTQDLNPLVLDFSNATAIDFAVQVNKIGTGTQSWQLWNETDAVQIGVIDDAGASGLKLLTARFTTGLPSGPKSVRVRAKSTVSTDDPVFHSAGIAIAKVATPSFQEAGLVLQLIQNVYGLTRDMRDNATGYKDLVIAGRPVAEIASMMVGDANEYVRRLGWVTDAVTRNQAIIKEALSFYGITLGQANTLKASLLAVANQTIAATLTNNTEINTEADSILANVPNYERLW